MEVQKGVLDIAMTPAPADQGFELRVRDTTSALLIPPDSQNQQLFSDLILSLVLCVGGGMHTQREANYF